MLNDAEQAFDELLDSAAEAKGKRIKCQFRGGPLEVAISTDPADYSPAGGGWASQTTIPISCRNRDIRLPINQNEEIVMPDKRVLAVLSYQQRPGYLELLVGDPAEEMD
jgi:hypothetical protein